MLKPPLGITPRFIWIEKRIDEIVEATKRYKEVEIKIPVEWHEELDELLKELSNRR